MLDWDKNLPQVVGACKSRQHSTTGINPFLMLTGKERAMPLTIFYPEYEGKKTSPQAYGKKRSGDSRNETSSAGGILRKHK